MEILFMKTKTTLPRATKKPAAKTEPKTTTVPVNLPVSRRVAPFHAHYTMLQNKLTGLRGKPQRAELLAKIAE